MRKFMVQSQQGVYLDHSQIPVWFYPLRQVDQSKGHHPIVHRGRIRIKWKDFQLDGIKFVNWNRRLGVRVQILIELFEVGVYSG